MIALGRRRDKDTLVICNTCGKEEWADFKSWPTCCGEEMEIAGFTESRYDRLLKQSRVRIKSKYSERRYIP